MLDKCVALSLELVLTIVLGLNAVNVNSGGIVPTILLLHVQCMLITVRLVLYGCPWNHGT